MISKIGRLLQVAAAAFFIACTPALAQWQAPNHSTPVGKGVGVIGFGSVGPCLANVPIVGAGVSADPVCGSGAFLPAALATNHIFVGSAGGVATDVAMSQDCTIVATGVITCLKTNNVNFGAFATGTDAANLTGTVASARISGSYTGITGVGVLAAGSTGAGFTVAFGTATFTGANAIANGGTGQTTAAAARGSSGLNIDECTSTGDANYTVLSTDRCVYHTALTAARTDTLPAANSVNVGQRFFLSDMRGASTATFTITLQRAGSDTVNGSTTFTAIAAAFGAAECVSDGSSRWHCQQFAGGTSAGTVTSVTCGTGLSGGTITTSGTCAVNLSVLTNAIGDIAVANGSYTDGPTVAQGTSGVWFASGQITWLDSNAGVSNFTCKLWDGTTVIASASADRTTAGGYNSLSLSGHISAPAANIKISCKALNATTTMKGADADSNINSSKVTVFRIQ